MSSKVECPVCNRSVSSDDINLHLDLQCPGTGESSRQAAQRSSQASSGDPPNSSAKEAKFQQKEKEDSRSSSADIVEIQDTPPRRTSTSDARGPATLGRKASSGDTVKKESVNGSGRHMASIFSKRKKPDEMARAHAEEEVKPDRTGMGGAAYKCGSSTRPNKKPRVNPMVAAQPLAERSRPSTLEGYVGQADIVGPGSLLRARIEAGEGVGSCILWGPPGCGKTTLARLIAKTANADFKELSATSSGAADVRQVFEQAKNGLKLTGRKTILMVDEIHRFTRPQQDLFLPYVENGWVQLIGATTENPSFKVNGALLSRCQVFTLSKHEPDALLSILQNALSTAYPLDGGTSPPRLPPDLLPFVADVADGDARQALNSLELALQVCTAPLPPVQTKLDASIKSMDGGEEDARGQDEADREADRQEERDQRLMDAVRKGLRKGYDRSGEERYDMISALHKCIRGSDGSAAMYWLARMITGGEDAIYIARRLVVVASEDVGLADPQALPLAMATYQACQVIGLPECRLNLAHCVAYLSEAPKSTRAYTAYKRVRPSLAHFNGSSCRSNQSKGQYGIKADHQAEQLASQTPLPPIPLQIRNAPTTLMRKLGYGKEYAYNPAYAHPVHNEYLPPILSDHSSFSPYPAEHILRTAEAEQHGKEWAEDKLCRWEEEVNGREKWSGRPAGGNMY